MSPDSAAPRGDGAAAIAAAVTSVPGVHALHAGVMGEIATYLPGHRINGVRLGDDQTDVHIVVQHGHPVLDVAESVRQSVRALRDHAVYVTVEDIAGPDEPTDPWPDPTTSLNPSQETS